MERDYPIWMSKIDYMNSTFDATTLIIGDSRAVAGIEPREMGDNYYNLAFGGGSPLDGYFTLKKIVENNNDIDLIVVSYAAFHLGWCETFFDRSIKFKYLSPNDFNYIFDTLNSNNSKFWLEGNIEGDYLSNLMAKQKCHLIQRGWPPYYRREMRQLLKGSKFEFNQTIYTEISKSKGFYSYGKAEFSDDLNQEANVKEFIVQDFNSQCLDSIFCIAQNNDIKVTYQCMPINEASYNCLTETFVNGYNLFFENLKTKYPQVDFRHEMLPYDNSYFGDKNHLNTIGRIKFTKELLEYIENNDL